MHSAGPQHPGKFFYDRAALSNKSAEASHRTGFTLLLAGAVMIITPGPGWLVIFSAKLLAAGFIWARRLMEPHEAAKAERGPRSRVADGQRCASPGAAEPAAESNDSK